MRGKTTSSGSGGSAGAPIEIPASVLERFSKIRLSERSSNKIIFTQEMDSLIMHPEFGWEKSHKTDFAKEFGSVYGIKSPDTLRTRFRELKELNEAQA